MQTEVEVKFLDINHDAVRKKLKELGAECVQPMRTMRRVTIDTPEMAAKNAFLRIRDEGNRVAVTYKQFDKLSIDGAREIEVEVNDFARAIELFAAAGLPHTSFQESKREAWFYRDTEVVLDEWPWLKPYIEIEGKNEEQLKQVAKELNFDWADAVFGDVMVAYRAQYPHLKENQTIGRVKMAKFGDSLPKLLIDRTEE